MWFSIITAFKTKPKQCILTFLNCTNLHLLNAFRFLLYIYRILLESSCNDILNQNHLGINKTTLSNVHTACINYKYFSPNARQVASKYTTLKILDEGIVEACETLDKAKLTWVVSLAKKSNLSHLCNPLLAQCYQLYQLSTNELLRLGMDRALDSKNNVKIVNAMYKFKEEFFFR